ncbi:MAG: PhzF family phenazine biosynthesis protein [Candidatus Aminicenantes bacterium]|nr:PhzF family phenazine biosynthesis protein [Candidatus Aminicenantes bacterium]
MSLLKFYILDVFAEEKYTGNQLAVFRDAADLSGEMMQKIAREMHFSETTFILSDKTRDGGYDVRIFTPETELPFAGHPTLGTAFVIQQEILKTKVERIVLNLGVGQIPVTFDFTGDRVDILWMKQMAPKFGSSYDREKIANLIRIESSAIDERFPVQEVSTGFFSLIVPLKSLDAVKRSRIDRDLYDVFVERGGAPGILVFAPETYNKNNQLNVRFFADALGVHEDPATGSANGCLAGYLVKNRYFGTSKIDIQNEQGIEINRPSLIHIKAEDTGKSIDINVGGYVILVAKSELV